MAESLAIVGVALATYATIDLIVRHTDLLADGLQSHHDLKHATQNLDAFRVKGATTELRQQLDLAKQILKTTNDEDVKANLDSSFEEIQRSLIHAEDLLRQRDELQSSLFSPVQRAKKKVKTEEVGIALKSLKAAKDLFTSITTRAAMQNALPSLVLLSSDDFQVIREFKPSEISVSLSEDTSIVDGHLKRQELGSSSGRGLFLLEKRETQEANVRGLAEILAAARNQSTSSPHGVLNCIGFRLATESQQREAKYHLVFALPSNYELENSLQGLMQSCLTTPQTLPPSLNQRIDLCYQLSNTVLQVHKLGLVHKNINTVNILAMRPKATTSTVATTPTQGLQATTIFLSGWHLVRKVGNASTFKREKDWWKRMYQHPERHLEHIEQEYNMYHDIYSLGVCMMEILLWQSLLVKLEGQNIGPSSLLQRAVSEISTPGGTASTGSSTQLADLDGQIVQDILIKVARTNLPPAVGTKLAGLVVSCLNCLEGGFGPISFSEKSMLTTISNFMTTIQKDLWDVKLAI
jgi:serine/threonine protein kinase